MFSVKLSAFILACFVAAVLAAPATEVPVAPTEATSATTSAPAATSAAPTTQAPGSTAAPETASAATPSAVEPKTADNSTAPMPVSSSQDSANSTSFTCFGRQIGYYADADLDCRVYHFCLQGDYNGEPVFQRISYLCLNETVFDQQALDCVQKTNVTAPCKDSATFYDVSNQILRKAIITGGKDN